MSIGEDNPSQSVSISVSDRDNVVILSFSKSIDWIELDPEATIEVADRLKTRAIKILRNKTK